MSSPNRHHYKVEYLFMNPTILENFTHTFYNQPVVNEELKKYWLIYMNLLWNRILGSNEYKIKINCVVELNYNPEEDYVNLEDEWKKEDSVCELDPSLSDLRVKLFN